MLVSALSKFFIHLFIHLLIHSFIHMCLAGYTKEFHWDTYLVDVANVPAPYRLFTSVCKDKPAINSTESTSICYYVFGFTNLDILLPLYGDLLCKMV